jgi:hypothetical protein
MGDKRRSMSSCVLLAVSAREQGSRNRENDHVGHDCLLTMGDNEACE